MTEFVGVKWSGIDLAALEDAVGGNIFEGTEQQRKALTAYLEAPHLVHFSGRVPADVDAGIAAHLDDAWHPFNTAMPVRVASQREATNTFLAGTNENLVYPIWPTVT